LRLRELGRRGQQQGQEGGGEKAVEFHGVSWVLRGLVPLFGSTGGLLWLKKL
jgi:hypothetical protein